MKFYLHYLDRHVNSSEKLLSIKVLLQFCILFFSMQAAQHKLYFMKSNRELEKC